MNLIKGIKNRASNIVLHLGGKEMLDEMTINIIKKKAIYVLKRFRVNHFIYRIFKPFSNKQLRIEEDVARKRLEKTLPKPIINNNCSNHIISENIDLQIVIPCFNVMEYIKECLDSILKQETKYSYKVIVVDDGSTDDTPEIVDSYAKYDCFEIVHQRNKGFSGARNAGFENIYSKYIMFLDSDDKLVDGAIQNLLDVAFKQDADIVEGGYYQFDDNGIVKAYKHKNENQINSLENLRGYPWGKVIRSKLFQNIKFPEGYWFEDSIFGYLIYPLAKRICTIADIVYYYRVNRAGITYTASKKIKCIDTYWVLEEMLKEQENIGIESNQYIYELVLQQIQLNFNRTYLMSKDVKKYIFILSSELVTKNFSGFKTTKINNLDLEIALRNRDYGLYRCFCTFN